MTGRRHLGVARALVDGAFVGGDVVIDDGTIEAVGVLPAGTGGTAVAGFVDLQVNGYGDIHLLATDRDGCRRIGQDLAAHGTTAWLPTLATASEPDTETALRVLAGAIAEFEGAVPLGVHLEGPFLSPARSGAHPRQHLRSADPALLDRYRGLAPVRLVTLAPELPGAIELIRHLVAHDIIVSVGHSDAPAVIAHDAFDAGASAHTHVWNAQRPIQARDPGTGAVALTRPDVAPMLIADLVHVAPEALSLAIAAASDRYILVTDAVGRPAGTTTTTDDGAVRLADGTLAGSTTPLGDAVRNVVDLGRPLEEVLAAVTERPAGLIGDTERGRLVPGGRADVVVLDDNLHVAQVLIAGVPVG